MQCILYASDMQTQYSTLVDIQHELIFGFLWGDFTVTGLTSGSQTPSGGGDNAISSLV